jgi:tripartite-type tricarboxylate transporter receptor subunit TctC
MDQSNFFRILRRGILRGAFIAFAALACSISAAQTYPSRPVRLIVPYGPGTVSDATARLFAERLSALWGQPVVVENMTGAAGVLGTQTIAKAQPDGYTLGMLASNHAMNAAIYPKLPYDPVKDFKLILHTSFNQFAFCINANVPANTLQEFIALARSKPNQLDYASSGNGGSPHLAMAKLAYMADIKLNHIPYRSNGAAITDLIGGRVAIMSTSISALLPYVKTGQLKALAVSGDTRSPLMPDVPTAAEAGVPGYSMKNWNGIVGPAALPQAIVDKIQKDLLTVLKEKQVTDTFVALGVEMEPLGTDEFKRRLVDEIASWDKVVKATGAKID